MAAILTNFFARPAPRLRDHPTMPLRTTRAVRLCGVSRRHALGFALPLLAAAANTAPALAGARDVATTKTYIRANYALVRASAREIAPSEAIIKTLLRRVREECPGAAAGSLQGEGSDKLGDELQGAMTIAALRPVARAVAAFVREVAGLRWSNAQLTRTVSSYARKLRTLSSLSAPQVCVDVRAWTASSFATLPASTGSFDLAFEAVDVALGEVPTELLAPYVRPAEKPMLHSSTRLEQQLEEAENRAVKRWEDTLQAIGVVP
jgi:hypothetical protein